MRVLLTRTVKRGLAVVLLGGLLPGLGACQPDQPGQAPTVVYHGIRPSDPGGRDGLRNPERGFRLEGTVAEVGVQAVPNNPDNRNWRADLATVAPFGVTMIVTSVYLDQFIGRDLSEEKLRAIQQMFTDLRRAGAKCLFVLAYEGHPGIRNRTTDGPTMDDIRRHLAQLKPLIRANADVIYLMPVGLIGLWGEWHGSVHHLESDRANLAEVTYAVLDALPPDRMTVLRTPYFKRWVLQARGDYQVVNANTAHTDIPAARLGLTDDGFLARRDDGGTWLPPFYDSMENPDFAYATEESPYVPVDGELYWSDQAGPVEGFQALVRMHLQHYSTFSLAHGYSLIEGHPYSLDTWMKTPVTREQVASAHLPVSDGYFTDASGQETPRTQFEYIRDHLGYRLELQDATLPQRQALGQPMTLTVRLHNRGFATFCNPRPVFFVLIGADNHVYKLADSVADPRRWQPFRPGDPEFRPVLYTLTLQLETGLPPDVAPGEYRVGLWLPDAYGSLARDPRYAVRVANEEVPWWVDPQGHYGINVLGTVQVLPAGE